MTRVISPESIDLALLMRQQRVSWKRIGRVIGVDEDVIRYRLDPEFAEKHRWRSRSASPGLMPRGSNKGPTAREIEALVTNVPSDTRNLTARAMGDPLPGRSALDRKRAQTQAVFHAKIVISQGRAY